MSKTKAIAVGGRLPNPAITGDTSHAVIYVTNDGNTWKPVAAPDTTELFGVAAFTDATYVADVSGRIWRWVGSPLTDITPTPDVTETPTATSDGDAHRNRNPHADCDFDRDCYRDGHRNADAGDRDTAGARFPRQQRQPVLSGR